jgi:hypothetical protein
LSCSITNRQGNGNQNHNDKSLTPKEWLLSERLKSMGAGKGVEQREPLLTLRGKVNYHSHYGKLYGVLKNLKIEVPV